MVILRRPNGNKLIQILILIIYWFFCHKLLFDKKKKQKKNQKCSNLKFSKIREIFCSIILYTTLYFQEVKKNLRLSIPFKVRPPQTEDIVTRCTKKPLPFLQYNPRFPLCPNANFYMYQKHVTPECLRWSTNGSDSVTS